MQGLVVLGLIVEKIWNVDVNCVKVTSALNVGQGYQIKVPAKSGCQGDVSCKVWWLFSLAVDENTNFDVNVELRPKYWQTDGRTENSACIKGSLGVRDSQKLPWDFQTSLLGSLGLPTFKDI